MTLDLDAILATPAFRRRLSALADGADASTPLSLGIDLGGGGNWLERLPKSADYWYWAQPEHHDYRLGLGTALQIASAGPARFAALANSFAGLAGRWRYERLPGAFIGFAFDEQARSELPNALLAIPAIALHSRGGRSWATFTTVAGAATEAIEHWRALLSTPAGAGVNAMTPRLCHPLAERAWLARVDAARRDIAAGRLDKVVLARSVKLGAALPIAAAPVLSALLAKQPSSTIYAHARRHRVFLGASPERLASLSGRRAEADALAGTAWPDAYPPSSRLEGDKNRREQQLVVDAVRAALAPLCTRLEAAAPPGILHLPRLSHLHSRLAGEAKPGITLFDLIRSLHPTPAVGGSPTAVALDWLRAHGETRGAWYSGGIGHIDADGNGEIAVALRCALISGREAELYAGAGIVSGSQAVQELAETEAKLATMRDALDRAAANLLERTGTQ